MSTLACLQAGDVVACRPWPRTVLGAADWAALGQALIHEPLELIALWADTAQVHALFAGPLLVSTPVIDGAYAALSPWRPVAAGLERMVRDLWGHTATGGVDARPLLDHGAWEMARPMAIRPGVSAGPTAPALRPGPEGLYQMPLGPVLPGITEPVHWRLHAAGASVRQAEAVLGYAHKGSLVLMRGKSPRIAARFAARLAGDATVAHAVAFARAAEAALAIQAPPRAHVLRGVMAELERAAVHLGDLTQLCAAAGFARRAASFGAQREALLVAASVAFGHRLMMDAVVPGGVAADIAPGGAAAILAAVAGLHPATAVMSDRLAGLGQAAVAALAPGGVAGRAAGRPGDARVTPGYPPYDRLPPVIPLLATGCADARTRVRLAEVAESVRLMNALLQDLPPGSICVALPSVSGEGLGVAESVRGDVWHWLRLDGGMIATAFAADPGWRLWPLAEQALVGADMADVPLILRSFGASASGVDL